MNTPPKRRLCDSSIASWMTLCPKPRQTYVSVLVHGRHELDECRKCFRACIHAKGGHFSI